MSSSVGRSDQMLVVSVKMTFGNECIHYYDCARMIAKCIGCQLARADGKQLHQSIVPNSFTQCGATRQDFDLRDEDRTARLADARALPLPLPLPAPRPASLLLASLAAVMSAEDCTLLSSACTLAGSNRPRLNVKRRNTAPRGC